MILVTQFAAQLTAEQQSLVDQLSAQCPDLVRLCKLAAEFQEVFRDGEGQALQAWTINAEHSGIGPLARFAAGLKKDFPALRKFASVTARWKGGATV